MQIHQLQPKHKSKDKKIVGRGGKKGTYSGRGGKGQSARSGRKMVPIIRELIKRYPKLKGYRATSLHENMALVSLEMLEEKMTNGEVVTPEVLVKKHLVKTVKGRIPTIKILGDGQLTKKITVSGCKFSKSAQVAIQKAGGEVK